MKKGIGRLQDTSEPGLGNRFQNQYVQSTLPAVSTRKPKNTVIKS